ncbi:MAG: TetR/AcrR family transcriptional regulator [Gordonia sp. (in: high G+C Gram-positive bacteria)]|uniref:TetR/AcrR family transcriptional regulator n=1 Tax=Gordonia sp. (in: high G+C Gram-positive bacteria) TaxID=84139 RepID=UPI0039E5AC33
MAKDWLVGDNREDQARERLYALASDLMAARGVDGMDINELARRAHCSRATVYRHVGGKNAIVEAVLSRRASEMVATVAAAAEGLDGKDRIAAVMGMALDRVRSDGIARQFLDPRHVAGTAASVVGSPTVLAIAGQLLGQASDTAKASVAVRSVLDLLLWPPASKTEEAAVVDVVAAALAA